MKKNKFLKKKNMAKWVLKTSNNYYNLYAAFSPRQNENHSLGDEVAKLA